MIKASLTTMIIYDLSIHPTVFANRENIGEHALEEKPTGSESYAEK
jgi:hypothetical protein